MSEQRYFVTGGLGFIGAWVVRNLVEAGALTTVFDISGDSRRLRPLLSDDELAQVHFVAGDITDPAVVEVAVRDSGASHIIHLAGLQIPFCKADPVLGARVNVVGTVNVFGAARQAGLHRVVYASSTAVYGPKESYPPGPLAPDAPHLPSTLYGVYKQANEGTARIYWQDHGISSIGLRPYVVYGVGRDQGMTSEPTKAMLAAAQGLGHHIGFGGRLDMQYADDIARMFIQCTQVPFEGAGVFNPTGSIVHMSEVVAAIEAAAPEVRGRVTFDDKPLPYPEEMDATPLAQLLGGLTQTLLAQAVADTIALFGQAIAAGRFS